jgi:pimeloyl-ACP methyl ester carboxylesterase
MSRLSRQAPSLAAPAALILLAAACSNPVTVKRVSARRVHRDLTANALSTGAASGATRNVLEEWGAAERFAAEPEAVLADLHAAVAAGRAGDREVFALAELSFVHAEAARSRPHYLAAAAYAYAFLFPAGAGGLPDPFDPRYRTAADLYNRGLTSGLASADGSRVELRPGSRRLPFGELAVEMDDLSLRWGDRRLIDFVPVAELEVRGLRVRYRRTGIGAPLAAGTEPWHAGEKPRDFVGKGEKVPVTAFLRIDDPRRSLETGRLQARLEIHDAYLDREVEIDGRPVPLEVEPTACLAYTLSESSVWDWEFKAFFTGDFLKGLLVGNPKKKREAQVLFVHPYRRGLVPVLFVHGTASSPGRWADMLNTLQNEPSLRGRFQFWFFYYDTGNPIVHSADLLRESMRNVVEYLDPLGTDPALREIVVIGHSQGGLLSKMLAVDSGNKLWEQFSNSSLDELLLREDSREFLRRSLFVQPVPNVRRIVYIATPHRGSYVAGSWIAQQLTRFMSLPRGLVNVTAELLSGNPGAISATATSGLLSSVHNMTPGNSFVQALAELPAAPGIAEHSIVAVSGSLSIEEDDDGVVEYASAHLEDADSEVVIQGGHSIQSHPRAISEVSRILNLHAAEYLARSREDAGGRDAAQPVPAASVGSR